LIYAESDIRNFVIDLRYRICKIATLRLTLRQSQRAKA